MPAVMIGCTYLGVALCYAAAPSTSKTRIGPAWGRFAGLVLLGLGGAWSVTTSPIGEGLLVWGATAMAAGSVLVIAAPILPRFTGISGTLAGGLIVFGLFL